MEPKLPSPRVGSKAIRCLNGLMNTSGPKPWDPCYQEYNGPEASESSDFFGGCCLGPVYPAQCALAFAAEAPWRQPPELQLDFFGFCKRCIVRCSSPTHATRPEKKDITSIPFDKTQESTFA